MAAPSPADLGPVLRAFGLSGEPQPLPGGTTTTFRVGGAVLKRIHETSLENNHSPALAAWIAEWTERVPQEGFRLPLPLKTTGGAYITADGWTAMEYLPGRMAQPEDIPACMEAAAALHRAIAQVPEHPLMRANTTAWGTAHHHCWNEPPAALQPQLRPLVESLYTLRRPIPTSPWQLMHGDLSPANFLVAPGLPPVVLDFSPFWGPPEFALAIFANFSGPRRFDLSTLRHFEGIPNFDQLLVRAALRMLLVVSALNGLDGWEEAEEKWAAEQVIAWVRGRSPVSGA